MRLARPSLVGASVGMLAAFLIIGSASMEHQPVPMTGTMLPEHGGPIRSLVMQYTSGSDFVWPVYRQFLQYQPPSVSVYMVCPTKSDFDEIDRQLTHVNCTVTPVLTGHPITSWARDRWVELAPLTPGGPPTLLAPKGELQQENWPQRAGDSKVADDVGRALSPMVRSARSNLYFDGGDLLADDNFVFATSAVLRRNLQHTAVDRRQLIAALELELHKPVIVTDSAPDHHAGMYMMGIGHHRMVVGDPSLAFSLLDHSAPTLAAMEGGPDFSTDTQERFESVAAVAREQGYQVTRIPTVPSYDGKRYLTYVNVIMDFRNDREVAYMPIYRDQPRLNAAAIAVWSSLNFQVIPIDCSSLWSQGGTLHCLVNVLQRESQ